MVARTSTWAGSPEALDKWTGHVRNQVSGFVRGLPGNVGAVFLVDRDAGTALTLTMWDSEDAASATDQFADQSRASTIEATGVELRGTGAYEVVERV
jgi:heme-degrading monooxygenase HmoA